MIAQTPSWTCAFLIAVTCVFPDGTRVLFMEHGGRLTRQARKGRRQEPMESSVYKETLAPTKHNHTMSGTDQKTELSSVADDGFWTLSHAIGIPVPL